MWTGHPVSIIRPLALDYVTNAENRTPTFPNDAEVQQVIVDAQNAALLPVFLGVFATQGCLLVKAGLAARGFAPGGVRRGARDAPYLPRCHQAQ